MKPPAHIGFTIGVPGAGKSWRFRSKAGEKLEAEVLARRLGSPLDARLTLRNAAGKTVAENDDAKGPRIGTVLHQADPRIDFVVPADGEYSIEVADASGTGGPEAAGILRLAAPEPDFECYVYPSGIAAAPDVPTAVRVLAIRRGGFAGRIVFGTPPDSPVRILGANSLEPGMERGLLTLASSRHERPDGRALPIGLYAFGERPDGTMLRRPVRPADEAMQAFAYTHLIPAEKFLVTRAWGSPHGRFFRAVDPGRNVRIAPGGKAEMRLWRRPPDGVSPRLSLVDPPAGVTLAGSRVEDGIAVLELRAAADAPECSANTALRVDYHYTDKRGKRQRVSFLLPAFHIEVKK